MLETTLEKVCRVVSNTADRTVQAEDTFHSLGLDSLDVVEVMLDLENAFPKVELYEYLPTVNATARELANEIDRLKEKA